MAAENPTGDFNCRSPQWWENDTENEEGIIFEPLTSDLGLHQMISEPTHLMGQSRSCVDLIFTDQPNLLLETVAHPTLHEQCHHQIVYDKLAVNNLAPPSYTRRIWFFDRANVIAVRRSIEMFHRHETLDEVSCPIQQVSILN